MRKLIAFSVALLLLASCQKKEETTNPENSPNVEDPNYFPMKIGSYWVYENYKIDPDGTETKLPDLDSIVILRDSLINNNNYFIFEGNSSPYSSWKILSILRDSSGFIVNPKGEIVFSTIYPSDTLNTDIELQNNDTIFAIYYIMDGTSYNISTPAGNFEALKTNGIIYMQRDDSEYLIKDNRELNYFYSPNIGKTIDTWFYASTDWYNEKRILHYYIPDTN